ncbi:hypothetical protein RB195_017945 [Necator americanus]|uniref:Uncharacterized protein n=1 Tax=Necator americanus TaxID=51031 RepID=A0ABR1C7G4_NECAM
MRLHKARKRAMSRASGSSCSACSTPDEESGGSRASDENTKAARSSRTYTFLVDDSRKGGEVAEGKL